MYKKVVYIRYKNPGTVLIKMHIDWSEYLNDQPKKKVWKKYLTNVAVVTQSPR